jgi:hypothetical protein
MNKKAELHYGDIAKFTVKWLIIIAIAWLFVHVLGLKITIGAN